MNPHDEQKITARDEGRKARAAKRASAAAFLPANDRFKQSYSALTYLGLILATALHFAVFEFFPQLEAADLGTVSEELSAIELPPEVRIPPPPEQIARPVAAAQRRQVRQDQPLLDRQRRLVGRQFRHGDLDRFHLGDHAFQHHLATD